MFLKILGGKAIARLAPVVTVLLSSDILQNCQTITSLCNRCYVAACYWLFNHIKTFEKAYWERATAVQLCVLLRKTISSSSFYLFTAIEKVSIFIRFKFKLKLKWSLALSPNKLCVLSSLPDCRLRSRALLQLL